MPLGFLATVLPKYLPLQHLFHVSIAIVIIAILRAFSQGRVTDRERDLHGRVILLTGGFTPTGSALMEALAKRGAHIIALCNDPVESEHISLLVEALRETTKNSDIFAEECDLRSAKSVRAFCTKFLTGKDQRLDAIVLAHEYEHVGPIFATESERKACDEQRSAYSNATFLIITLLLPVLLVAPPERDIRIINVINPFYAAATPFFPNPPRDDSQFQREGFRALKTAVLTRHLQRVFDALPAAPAPNPDKAKQAVASAKIQKSNIVAVSVSPGFSRADTIARILRADGSSPEFRISGLMTYILIQPFLRIFAKSSFFSIQTILHALFLPTPFKRVELVPGSSEEEVLDVTEILRPGALYSDCSVVQLQFNEKNWSDKLAKAGDSKKPKAAEEKKLKDDGEMGGEELGRFVWESYEQSLRQWEAETGGSDAKDSQELTQESPKDK